MKPSTQKKSKVENVFIDVLRNVEVINPEYYPGVDIGFRLGLLKFGRTLNDSDWNFNDKTELPNFHSLYHSIIDIDEVGGVSKYQRYCIVKLSSIMYDARLLYENNLIDIIQLQEIAYRVKKDLYKRSQRIKKIHERKELKDKKLDSDSLLLLQAKLAILENEN